MLFTYFSTNPENLSDHMYVLMAELDIKMRALKIKTTISNKYEFVYI